MQAKKILFPTDFSAYSKTALEHASSLARDCGATLVIVYVKEPVHAVADAGFSNYPIDDDDESVSRMLNELTPGDQVPCERRKLTGNPAQEIVRLADEEDMDMIVMGTHGRTGLTRMLMGSVAEAVVRRAKCPVLTVRTAQDAKTGAWLRTIGGSLKPTEAKRMNNAIQRLKSLCVSDVMSRDVVGISANQLMQEAAAQLARNDVSAAPVVDEQGRCVGVLSAADFLKREQDHSQSEETSFTAAKHDLVHDRGAEPWHIESEPYELVRSHMTTAVQSVSGGAPLLAAATIMNAEHIHRLVVLDESERPIGVISTMDIVAALINAVDEMDNRSDSRKG